MLNGWRTALSCSPGASVPNDEAVSLPIVDRNPFASIPYRWWWVMTLCVSLAVGVQIVTVPTFVLDRTHVRFYVALAVLCQTVPTALFTLIGGASADRIGQRRILRTTLAIGASTSLAFVLLSLFNVRQIWPAFIIAAVVGSASAFQSPSRQSLINRLAPGTRLQNGIIWGTLAFMGGQSFLGPALAGLTIAVFGQTAGFALEVLLLLSARFCASHVQVAAAPSGAGSSLLTQITAGLRHVRANPSLWQVLVLGAVPGLFFIGVNQATFPVLARDTFGRGASGIALLNAALGVGTLTGSVLLIRWGPQHHRGRWFLCSLLPGGLACMLVGVAPSLLVAMILLTFWGLAAAIFINFASTLLQTYTEPAYIGRVLSIYSLAFLAVVPLGNLHAGLAIQLAGPRVPFLYSGILAALLGLIALISFRTADSLD
ncbi:MAG: MFS transporter [Dehalococcoidia bacterium]